MSFSFNADHSPKGAASWTSPVPRTADPTSEEESTMMFRMRFKQSAHRKAVSHRLRITSTLERLEDRAVPSTLTVASAADSGPNSLRAEIAAAHKGDTIVFAPNLDGQTIKLSTGKLLIKQHVT